jgi:large subunit ribosomal protein L29
MKWADMKQLDDGAVKAKIVELKKELMNLRFQKVSGQLEKAHPFKVARRNIARLSTLLNQRKKAA